MRDIIEILKSKIALNEEIIKQEKKYKISGNERTFNYIQLLEADYKKLEEEERELREASNHHEESFRNDHRNHFTTYKKSRK